VAATMPCPCFRLALCACVSASLALQLPLPVVRSLGHPAVRPLDVVVRSHVRLAGFGGATPAKAKPAKGAKGGKGGKAQGRKAQGGASKGLSARKQWDLYTKVRDGGSPAAKVFARDGAIEGDEWLFVGSVAAEQGQDALAAAAHYQKRLILEHAARMSPRLHVAKNTLELGWEVDGEIAKVAKADVPELACGFVGEPDPGGFYSKGNRVEKNTAASGAAPMADSKGRIG